MAVDLQDTETGQIRVETGTGLIEKLDRRERNIGVTIRSDNPAMRKPVVGWLDTMSLGEDAHPQLAEGLHIRYRIHVRRKDGVDPATPIGQLDASDKVRDLVVLSPIEAPRDTAGPEAVDRAMANNANPTIDELPHEPAPGAESAAADPLAALKTEAAAVFFGLAANAAEAGASRLDEEDPRAARARRGAEVFRSIAAELTGGA